MFRAAASPSGYAWHALSPALYLTVLVCTAGYFAFMWAGGLGKAVSSRGPLPVEIRLALYSAALYIGFLHAAETQSFVYFQF
jgi:hypothetical protein